MFSFEQNHSACVFLKSEPGVPLHKLVELCVGTAKASIKKLGPEFVRDKEVTLGS